MSSISGELGSPQLTIQSICLVGFPQKLNNQQSNEDSETTRRLLAEILPRTIPQGRFSSFHISFMSDAEDTNTAIKMKTGSGAVDTTALAGITQLRPSFAGSIATLESEAIDLLKHLHDTSPEVTSSCPLHQLSLSRKDFSQNEQTRLRVRQTQAPRAGSSCNGGHVSFRTTIQMLTYSPLNF